MGDPRRNERAATVLAFQRPDTGRGQPHAAFMAQLGYQLPHSSGNSAASAASGADGHYVQERARRGALTSQQPTDMESTTMARTKKTAEQDTGSNVGNLQCVDFARKSLVDLAGAHRQNLTGQSRMIAALLFAHREAYFEGQVSPGGVTVDLATAYRDIDTRMVKRTEASERIHFILGHLFGVMEFSEGKWQLASSDHTPALLTAYRVALRRVLPTVGMLIEEAGNGPCVQVEYQDADMLASGAACAIITAGPSSGRLKVRADLLASADELRKAQEAGQDLSKHPPQLLDGSAKHTIEQLGRVARERLGLVAAPVAQASRNLGSLASALLTIRNQFRGYLETPELAQEAFPKGLLSDAKSTCATMLRVLFNDPKTHDVNLDAVEEVLDAEQQESQARAA